MELLRGIQLGGGVLTCAKTANRSADRARSAKECSQMMSFAAFHAALPPALAKTAAASCEYSASLNQKGGSYPRTAVRPHFGLATDAWRCGAGQLLSLWRCCLAWSARPQRRPVRRRPADSCAPLPETAWRSIAADPRCFLAPAASVSTPIVPRGPCLGCSRLARGSARDRGRERGAGSLSQPFTP